MVFVLPTLVVGAGKSFHFWLFVSKKVLGLFFVKAYTIPYAWFLVISIGLVSKGFH